MTLPFIDQLDWQCTVATPHGGATCSLTKSDRLRPLAGGCGRTVPPRPLPGRQAGCWLDDARLAHRAPGRLDHTGHGAAPLPKRRCFGFRRVSQSWSRSSGRAHFTALASACDPAQANEHDEKARICRGVDDDLSHPTVTRFTLFGNTIDAGSGPGNAIGVAPGGGTLSFSCALRACCQVCRPLK